MARRGERHPAEPQTLEARVAMQLSRDIAAAKELLAELRGQIQEAREVRKALREEIASIAPSMQTLMEQAAGREIEKMTDLTMENIERAEAKIYKRFDTVADVLLGVTGEVKKKNLPSFEELAKVLVYLRNTPDATN